MSVDSRRRLASWSRACVVGLVATLLAVPVPGRSAETGKAAAKKSASKSAKAGNRKTAPRKSTPKSDAGDPRATQAEQSVERDRLTARIAELKQQIAVGERSRSGAAASLKRAEKSLAVVTRRLDELARRQRESQDRIVGLDRQRAGTEGQIAVRQAAFGRTALLIAANRDRDPLHAWLGGGDPGEGLATESYLQVAARADANDIDGLRGRARDLQAQRQKADDDARTLVAQAEVQKSTRDSLAADQAAQRKSLVQISEQLAQQRSAAAALAADEQRLTRVVEQLQRVIDRQAADERAKRQAAEDRAKRQAEAPVARKDRAPKAVDAAPPVTVDSTPDATRGNGAFAQLRGQLRLPVRGAVVGRFGAPRGTSGATWKGVFVRTETGAEVHAVAAGRVVFADDLRGFGNLVIVDHGDQYLSIYGNNETLLKHAGDTIRPGDVVARAGNSSGDEQTGLYFELRFQGRPFDPMTWTGPR